MDLDLYKEPIYKLKAVLNKWTDELAADMKTGKDVEEKKELIRRLSYVIVRRRHAF